jgi:hypothetical protein
MKVFIGSSSEAAKIGLLGKVAQWIESAHHMPLRWDDPEHFRLGGVLWGELRRVAHEVEAAIFIFAEDDRQWFAGAPQLRPRDNVLIEYGLFTGILDKHSNGTERTIICRHGKPTFASDLGGILYADLNQPEDARIRVTRWLRELSGRKVTREITDVDKVQLLEILKGRGISDPNVDLLIARYKGDNSGIEMAIKNRANEHITLRALLETYHDLVQSDEAYRKLMDELI